ncbi:MAG: DUF489 family protein [Salinisphaeraceae bacterium]
MSGIDNATRNQALALAGIAQFVLDAHRLADSGRLDRVPLADALHVIFTTNPDRAEDVLGDPAVIRDGAAFLRRQFGRREGRQDDAPTARAIGLVVRLGKRLLARNESLTQLSGAIGRAKFADDDRQIPGILDQAYRDILSPIGPRIMVRGNPEHLQNIEVTEHVRVLLMAAVRCAVLWYHCGGRLWRLLVLRKRLLAALDDLPGTAGAA